MDSEFIYQDVKRMKQKIDVLGLSQTAYERLYWSGCKTLGKLSKMTVQDLLKIYGIGKIYCSEIVEKAAAVGIVIPDLEEPKEKRTYNTVSKTIYPQNLLMDLFQCDAEDSRILNIDPDRNAGISVALSYLDERAAIFVTLRYKQCATYEEIGNYFGVSGSRGQQLIQESLVKLRRSSFRVLVSKGLRAYIEELVSKDTQERVEARLKAEYLRGYSDGVAAQKEVEGAINQSEDSKKHIAQINDWSVLGMTIDELNLSLRSTNCLKRDGIKTVADIIRLDEKEILQIRNLGLKSIQEISYSLAMHGISNTNWNVEKLREMRDQIESIEK